MFNLRNPKSIEARAEETISKLVRKVIVEAKGRMQYRAFTDDGFMNEFGFEVSKWGRVREVNLHPYGTKPDASNVEKMADYEYYLESRSSIKQLTAWSISSVVILKKDNETVQALLTQVFHRPDKYRTYVHEISIVKTKTCIPFLNFTFLKPVLRQEIIVEGKMGFGDAFREFT